MGEQLKYPLLDIPLFIIFTLTYTCKFKIKENDFQNQENYRYMNFNNNSQTIAAKDLT